MKPTKEQIVELLKSYRIWFGDAMGIPEDAFLNMANEILALFPEIILLEDGNIVFDGRVYQPHPTMIYGNIDNLPPLIYLPIK